MNQSNPDNRSNRDMSMAARSAADLPIAPPPPPSNPPPPPRMRPPASAGVAIAAQGMAPEIRAAIPAATVYQAPTRATAPFVAQITSTNTIEQMVRDAHDKGASDIHLRTEEAVRFRIRGAMTVQPEYGIITVDQFSLYLAEILNENQRRIFAETMELDTAIYYPGFLRCRVNCFESLTGGAIVFRLIPLTVPTVDSLGLPQVLKQFIERPQGLILVTGPTGSGKSTSIAAMIRHLNDTDTKHIVTIEDPIEYVHQSNHCLVSQREVGVHTTPVKVSACTTPAAQGFERSAPKITDSKFSIQSFYWRRVNLPKPETHVPR